MKKETFNVLGMHCNSCTALIEKTLKARVSSVKASLTKNTVEVTYDEKKISRYEIKKIIKELGYSFPEDSPKKSTSQKIGFVVMLLSFLLLSLIIYNSLVNLKLSIPSRGESISLMLLFVVGLFTGFHCISMCGAFVVSYTTRNALRKKTGFGQHLVYGLSKTASYAIIGGIMGLIGGIISFSISLRAGISIIAGLFMLFYGLGMAGFSWFKFFQFKGTQLTNIAAKQTLKAKGEYKAPFITGLLNGLFIACGPLQAMYIYAAGTGSVVQGSASMIAFGLGTLPVLLGFGSLASKIGKETTARILKISAIIVIILGLIMLNRGLTLAGSSLSFDSIKTSLYSSSSNSLSSSSNLQGNTQTISMTVDRYGWTPDTFTLKKGVKVIWNIDVKELTSCNNEIIVKDYGLDIKLKEGLNTVEFTPDKTGTIRWSCWMGMIPGTFIVTEDGTATQQTIKQASATQKSGSCGMGGGCGCGMMK